MHHSVLILSAVVLDIRFFIIFTYYLQFISAHQNISSIRAEICLCLTSTHILVQNIVIETGWLFVEWMGGDIHSYTVPLFVEMASGQSGVGRGVSLRFNVSSSFFAARNPTQQVNIRYRDATQIALLLTLHLFTQAINNPINSISKIIYSKYILFSPLPLLPPNSSLFPLFLINCDRLPICSTEQPKTKNIMSLTC